VRPVRLELEGFTSFRGNTVVDFDGADYFALVGPTGSGKSSLIDAMCFVLYGSLPRYDRKGLVAPVISQGKLEAKVRLDFTVGSDSYTAVRAVKRGTATKTTAQLERGGEVLAGTGPEVTEAVTELLGLTFEHFTKCVVLPQGDFARFLHDDPKDRQDFLMRLLNLGIYEVMQQEANARSRAAKDRIGLLEDRLADEAGWATSDTLAEAKAVVKRLDKLRATATESEPALKAFEKQIADSDAILEGLDESLEALSELEMPDHAAALADALTSATKLVKEAEEALKETAAAHSAALKALEALPARAPLDAALGAHRRRAELAKRLEEAQKEAKASAALEATTTADVAAAESAHAAASAALQAAQDSHQAQHLAGTLTVGAPCPVCLRPIDELPDHEVAADLVAARRAVEEAETLITRARANWSEATSANAASQSTLKALALQDEEIEAEIAGHKDLGALEKSIAQIDAAEEAVAKARTTESAARSAADEVRRGMDDLQEELAEAWQEFRDARDSVASLKPPASKQKDLAADWSALVDWAGKKIPDLDKKVTAARKEVEKAEKERDKLVAKLEASCSECEVDIADGQILAAVVAAHSDAQREVKDIQKALDAADAGRKEIAALQIEQGVAHQLAQHLAKKAGGFVGWIVNEALERLVEGATLILRELSNDQYALTVDESGTFWVTDRNNADERRSARTLSGGETFLASLSLALALADQLGQLAAGGAAKLEAIFLDEGFGTLDPETLDTVAATVENLAAAGRMVGVVTHVRDLASRIPTQFRVKKDVRTSTVERVSA
jgi:exonuclease SbcC